MTERAERRALAALLVLQTVVFLAVPLCGGPHGWAVLSSFSAEISADLLGGGEHPLDGYDGLNAGPLLWAAIEAPLLAVLGRIGLVHVLGTLLVALAATVGSWGCARRLMGPSGALVVAVLVAFPPPNTWVHQHYGAYQALPLATAPLGLWLLLRTERRLGWVVGAAVLCSSAAWSLGAVATAGPLLLGWLALRWRDGGARPTAELGCALAGAVLATAPLFLKALVHEPFAGLLPDGVAVAEATKPLLLRTPPLGEWPRHVAAMLARDLPYGLHFGLHGLPAVGAGWTLAGAIAWALALRARVALPWLLVPPGVVAVGLITGWFVFHPGDEIGFERDARHLLGLTQALAFAMGATVATLGTGTARRGALALVGLLAVASVATSVADARAGGTFDALSPWRLESRYVSGFFRGPHFAGAEATGLASCRSEDPLAAADCRRGVAIAVGHGAAGAPDRAARCSALGARWAAWCDFGEGWSFAGDAFRHPEVALVRCRRAVADPTALAACRRGVGWATAQDFADRPGAVASWTAGVAADERASFAEGVGLYASMMARERSFAVRLCGRLVPGPSQADCERGFEGNEGFMRPLR